MTSASEEIQQQKELEKKQKELDENNKKMNIDNNKYSKSLPLAGYRNEEMITHLHATYILHTM